MPYLPSTVLEPEQRLAWKPVPFVRDRQLNEVPPSEVWRADTLNEFKEHLENVRKSRPCVFYITDKLKRVSGFYSPASGWMEIFACVVPKGLAVFCSWVKKGASVNLQYRDDFLMVGRDRDEVGKARRLVNCYEIKTLLSQPNQTWSLHSK